MAGKFLLAGVIRAGVISVMSILLTVASGTAGPVAAMAATDAHGRDGAMMACNPAAGAAFPTSAHSGDVARIILADMKQEKGYIQYGTTPIPDSESEAPMQDESTRKKAKKKQQAKQKEWDVLQNLRVYVPAKDSDRPQPTPPAPPRLPGPSPMPGSSSEP